MNTRPADVNALFKIDQFDDYFDDYAVDTESGEDGYAVTGFAV